MDVFKENNQTEENEAEKKERYHDDDVKRMIFALKDSYLRITELNYQKDYYHTIYLDKNRMLSDVTQRISREFGAFIKNQIYPADVRKFNEFLKAAQAVREEGHQADIRVRMQPETGYGYRWVQVSMIKAHPELKNERTFYLFYKDIDSEMQEEERVKRQERNYLKALMECNDQVIEFDFEKNTYSVLHQKKGYLGVPKPSGNLKEEYLELLRRIHYEDRGQLSQYIDYGEIGYGDPVKEKLFSLEYRVRDENDGYRWVLATYVCFEGEEGRSQKILGLMQIIDERKKSEEEEKKLEIKKVLLEQRAREQKKMEEALFVDRVTGIANYEKFKLEATDLLNRRQDQEFLIFYFGIKSFKLINTNYGYEAGDKVLLYFSRLLMEYCSGRDGLVARIAGDEFVCMITKHEQEDIFGNLEKLKKRMNEWGYLKANHYSLSFYAGILEVCELNHNLGIVNLVDRALLAYNTVRKDSSHGLYRFFDAELLDKMLRSSELEQKMEDALKDGEFRFYAQPKFDLEDEHMTGAEALIRWNSPEKGLISPGFFIPIAEKNSFVVELDFFMMEECCKLIKKYENGFFKNHRISVNNSRITLGQPNYLERLDALVEKYDLPTKSMEIEITESMVMDDYQLLLRVLNQLKERGFMISMDDFGSEYSSLRLLKELPIDVLKIDQVFLNDDLASKNSKAIIRSVINMAGLLDIQVICEGVENKTTASLLAEFGCKYGQGFYYSRPVPKETFEEMLKVI